VNQHNTFDGAASPDRRHWLSVAAVMFGVGWGANQFTSLLLAYHDYRGVPVGTDQALFGVYALGLAPALLLGGPASDRWGRGRLVRPAVAVSVLATVVLMLGVQSTPALYAGRFLAGAASGATFAAGTAWVKELSVPPYDMRAGEQAGARRAAIALTAGFGLGPVVTGLIGQWAADPLVVAYLPHLVVMVAVIPGLWRVPETVPSTEVSGAGLADRLAVPSAVSPRFLTVVAPIAPWVFGAPAVAFAVLPSVISAHTHGYGIAFAGVTAGLTLAVGILVQPLARRLDAAGDTRGSTAGLVAVIGGMLVAALAAHLGNPIVVLVAATLLGAGYGFILVSGLLEVQRLAGPDELAGLTAVFYTLTYVGFAAPIVLAELTGLATYPTLMLALAGLATISLVVMTYEARRHPTGRRSAAPTTRSSGPPR
jgi:hypothetical protein